MDVSIEYLCFFLYLREIFQHKWVISSEREITLFDYIVLYVTQDVVNM